MSFSLESAPTYIAGYLGITEDTAAVLLSACIIMALVLPVAYLSKADKLMMLFSFFFSEAICVGLTWLPFWMLIATACLMAFGVAVVGTDAVVGDG